MKKQNLLVELTLLFAMLLILGAAADAQVARKFDRIRRLGGDSISHADRSRGSAKSSAGVIHASGAAASAIHADRTRRETGDRHS